MHATCHALAIRSGLHFIKLAIDSYLTLYLATPFHACMQNVDSVVVMPLYSYLHLSDPTDLPSVMSTRALYMHVFIMAGSVTDVVTYTYNSYVRGSNPYS